VGLQWSVFIHDEDNIRLTCWSRDCCIGSAHFSAQELIESPANSADTCEVCAHIPLTLILNNILLFWKLFKSLTLEDKVRGKIRIDFIKEAFMKASLKESQLVTSVTIDPPMLATIYAISVFDLRSVHPFSRNYPVIRGQCGRKKWSSQVCIRRIDGTAASRHLL
jgi:hypothetical protein